MKVPWIIALFLYLRRRLWQVTAGSNRRFLKNAYIHKDVAFAHLCTCLFFYQSRTYGSHSFREGILQGGNEIQPPKPESRQTPDEEV